jgi:hypothetical protein
MMALPPKTYGTGSFGSRIRPTIPCLRQRALFWLGNTGPPHLKRKKLQYCSFYRAARVRSKPSVHCLSVCGEALLASGVRVCRAGFR